MPIPGVSRGMTHRLMLAIIRGRLMGFEIRQFAREAGRRLRRRSRRHQAPMADFGQLELFTNGN